MAVSVADVAVELGRSTPTSPQAEQWLSWINRAYRLVEFRLGSTAYAALDPDVLDDVVLSAVAEHARGWRDSTASQYTVSVDDGSTTRRFETSTGLLSIPEDLWARLEGTPALGASFSIGPA